jgi:hypothetical protein
MIKAELTFFKVQAERGTVETTGQVTQKIPAGFSECGQIVGAAVPADECEAA